MDDKRHLYDKARIACLQANEANEKKEWSTYRTYVDKYNELLTETAQICGDEVYQYMSPIELSRRVSAYPMEDAARYMSTAVNKLRELMAYLQRERQKWWSERSPDPREGVVQQSSSGRSEASAGRFSVIILNCFWWPMIAQEK